jgi:hypothetical protein
MNTQTVFSGMVNVIVESRALFEAMMTTNTPIQRHSELLVWRKIRCYRLSFVAQPGFDAREMSFPVEAEVLELPVCGVRNGGARAGTVGCILLCIRAIIDPIHSC